MSNKTASDHARSDDRLLVGLMTGNSLDGISAALVRTRGEGLDRTVTVPAHLTYPISPEMRQTLFSFHIPNTFRANELMAAHTEFGEQLALAAKAVMQLGGVPAHEVSVIGVQAANLIHAIAGSAGEPTNGHLEVGELAVIAERTGCVVVGDLRPSDIALGGEGAPLSSFLDFVLFARLDDRSRAIQNLGGIANVTFLRRNCTTDDVISFDCGPANMVIDRLVARFSHGRQLFDEDGRRAARGEVNAELLADLLTHPYLKRNPPKTSRGPEDFGEGFVDQLIHSAAALSLTEDSVISTATQFTVECIADHYERFLPYLPDEVVLTGGGAHNLEIRRRLQERLPRCAVRLHDEFGVPGDAREATTWAVLADETVHGNPSTIPSATGASGVAVLGKVLVPSRYAHRFVLQLDQANA
jgi:anhydro-N-acetylmuramic acid kinase